MLSVMTVTSKPMSRQTVAVRRAPWKYGRVSGQNRRKSLPASFASFSIMPTIVSPKHCVMTVPPAGMSGTRYFAISLTLL